MDRNIIEDLKSFANVMLAKGHQVPVVVLIDGLPSIFPDFDGHAEKVAAAMALTHIVKEYQPEHYITLFESWVVVGDPGETNIGVAPSKSHRRSEMVLISGRKECGKSFACLYPITRSVDGAGYIDKALDSVEVGAFSDGLFSNLFDTSILKGLSQMDLTKVRRVADAYVKGAVCPSH